MIRPARLLTSNSELRAEGIANWSLPAWAGRLADGRTYNTCPAAGVCRQVCYALNGTYRFPGVLARHEANLAYVLDDLFGWQVQMTGEVQRYYGRRWVRIHDSGDFFADDYLRAWLDIATDCPSTGFYAYTKSVDRLKRLTADGAPGNFLWVYSYGGREDDLIDPQRDRVADVFPDLETMAGAGFADQSESDLLAVTGPRRVGVLANRIPHFRKIQGEHSFREWQAEVNRERRDREQRERLSSSWP